MTKHTGNVLVKGEHYAQSWSAVVLVSMIIFVASYASGLGNVPWQQGELFGLEGTRPASRFVVDSAHQLSPWLFCTIYAASPWHRNLSCDGNQLERQLDHQFDLSLAHGKNHALGRVRVLRRPLSTRVHLLHGLFP